MWLQLLWIVCTELVYYVCVPEQTWSDCVYTVATRWCREGNVYWTKVWQAVGYADFVDHVPYDLEDVDVPVLQHTLQAHHLVLCVPFPIHSGMVSLLYLAQHRETKQQVVIKVCRRTIRYQVARAEAQWRAWQPWMPPTWHAWWELQSKQVCEQLCLEREHRQLSKAWRLYARVPWVRIPRPWPFRTSALVMDYVSAESSTTITDPTERLQIGRRLLQFGILSVVRFGYCHGDLHAGNFLVFRDSWKLGILDWGWVHELSPSSMRWIHTLVAHVLVKPTSSLLPSILWCHRLHQLLLCPHHPLFRVSTTSIIRIRYSTFVHDVLSLLGHATTTWTDEGQRLHVVAAMTYRVTTSLFPTDSSLTSVVEEVLCMLTGNTN